MAKKPPQQPPDEPPDPGEPKPKHRKPARPAKPTKSTDPAAGSMPPPPIGAQGPPYELFDQGANAKFEGSKAIINAIRHMAQDHLAELFHRGAGPVHVQSMAFLMSGQIFMAFQAALQGHLQAKMIAETMAGALQGLPPQLVEMIKYQLTHSMGWPMLGAPSIEITQVGAPQSDPGPPDSIQVGKVTIDRDSRPKTGQELYAWAKIHNLTDQLNTLAAAIGAKGAPMSWSDEVVHSLHLKLGEMMGDHQGPQDA